MSKDILHFIRIGYGNSTAVCGFKLIKTPIPNTPLSTFNGCWTFQKHLTNCPYCLEVLNSRKWKK